MEDWTARDTPATVAGTSRGHSYTARAVAIGLVAVGVMAVGTEYAELWVHGTQVSQATPPINSFFVWAVVAVLLNALLRAFRRRLALNRGELLLIYSMLIASGGVAGIGFTQFIPPMTTAPVYYGTSETPWAEVVKPLLPSSDWFAPHDEGVVRYLFEGMPPTWSIPWRPWLKPLAAWGLFGLLLAWCTVCVSSILRDQWVENERLIFPLNYLPLAMTASREGDAAAALRPFFRNPIMWLGFTIPTVLHAFNSLHCYWPGVPELQIRAVRIDGGFTARPWNAMRPLSIWFYPMAVGLSYLLSRDISFSLWFFYFVGKAELVIGSLVGLSGGGGSSALAGFPFLAEQGTGALLMLSLGGLYVGRRHLLRLWRAATQQRDIAHSHSGVLSPPAAIWGLAVGIALILAWWKLAGMSVLATASYFAVWFLFAIGLSRLVCEGGTVWIGTPMDPRMLLRDLMGVPALTPRDWAMMGYLRFLTVDWRCLMMPNVLSAMKLTETGELQPRGLAPSMIVSAGLTIAVSFATMIAMAYSFPGGGIGLSTWRYVSVCKEPFSVTAQFLSASSPGPVWARVWFVGIGAAIMAGFQAMRARFLWWPLHPLGYPMLATFAMRNMWFSVLLAWGAKSLVLRYGGIPTYEKSRPFFLGLALGDFVNIALWLVVEAFTGVQDHFLYP